MPDEMLLGVFLLVDDEPTPFAPASLLASGSGGTRCPRRNPSPAPPPASPPLKRAAGWPCGRKDGGGGVLSLFPRPFLQFPSPLLGAGYGHGSAVGGSPGLWGHRRLDLRPPCPDLASKKLCHSSVEALAWSLRATRSGWDGALQGGWAGADPPTRPVPVGSHWI
jgi:hypothetical protein